MWEKRLKAYWKGKMFLVTSLPSRASRVWSSSSSESLVCREGRGGVERKEEGGGERRGGEETRGGEEKKREREFFRPSP